MSAARKLAAMCDERAAGDPEIMESCLTFMVVLSDVREVLAELAAATEAAEAWRASSREMRRQRDKETVKKQRLYDRLSDLREGKE